MSRRRMTMYVFCSEIWMDRGLIYWCIYRYQEMSGISIYESFIGLCIVIQDCDASVLLFYLSNYTYTIPISNNTVGCPTGLLCLLF